MVEADGCKPSESGIAPRDTNKTDCCRVLKVAGPEVIKDGRTGKRVLEREFGQALSVPSGARQLDFQKLALFTEPSKPLVC
jgi:hypothetical protein